MNKRGFHLWNVGSRVALHPDIATMTAMDALAKVEAVIEKSPNRDDQGKILGSTCFLNCKPQRCTHGIYPMSGTASTAHP